MAVGGNPIPEDIRAGLPPEALRLIDKYDEEYGAGNGVSFQIAQDFLGQPAPSVAQGSQEMNRQSFRRAPVSEADVNRLETEQLDALTTDISVNEGLSRNDARKKALEQFSQERQDRRGSRTAEGDIVSGSTEDDIRNAESSLTAFRRSLGPQIVKVGTQQQVDALGLPDGELNRLRRSVVINSKVEARRLAREQGLEYEFEPTAFNSFVDETSARLMKEKLDDLRGDFERTARNKIIQQRGLPEDAELTKEQEREITQQAQGEGQAAYDYIVPLVFEDLGRVEVDGVSLVPETKPGAIRRMNERIQKGEAGIGTYAGAAFYSQWHNFDPGSGDVAETWLSAIVRDIGLVPRAVYYPIIRATTWDMDPSTGDPYNKEDPMYKLSEWQEEQLANGNIAEKGAAFLSGIFLGHGYNLDQNMNLGSITRDLALSHSRGEMMGTDIGNLQSVRTAQNAGVLSHYWDEGFGLLYDVAVPGRALALPFKAGRKLTQGSATVVRNIAEAARFERTADVAEYLRASASSTDRASDALALRTFKRQAYEDLGLEPPPRTALRGAVEAPEYMVDKMAADLAVKTLKAEDYSSFRRLFSGLDDANPLMVPLEAGWSALQTLRGLQKLKGTAFVKKVDELEKSKSGKIFLAEQDAAVALKLKDPTIPDDVLAMNIVQGVMKNDLRKLVANHIPNNFVVAAPDLIVRRGAWLANQGRVNKEFAKVVKGDHLMKDGKAFFKYDNGKEVAELARRSFSRDEFSPAMNKVLDDLEKTGLVEQKNYRTINGLAKRETVLENIPVGGFAVSEPMDLAAGRAEQLTQGRQFAVARYAEDQARSFRAFFGGDSDYRYVVSRTGEPDSRNIFRPTPTAFSAQTPKYLKDWNKETVNRLNQTMRDAEDAFRESRKRNPGQPEKAADEVIQGVAGDDSLAAYEEMVNIFFLPNKMDLTDFFGREGDLSNVLKAAELPAQVTLQGLRQAIRAVREAVTDPDAIKALEQSALKDQKFSSIGITNTDNVTAAGTAYVSLRMAQKVYDDATEALIERYPNIVLTVPTKADANAVVDLFQQMALENGLERELVEKLSSNVRSAALQNKAHRQAIANAVVTHLYKEGNLATMEDLNRIYEAAKESVAGVVGTRNEIFDSLNPSIEGLRKIIKKAEPDRVEEIMRSVVPAFVQSVANINMNKVRAQFEALGVRSFIGKPKVLPVGLQKVKFGDGIIWYDQRLAELGRGLAKPDKRGSILKQVARLRKGERGAFDFIQESLGVTKKTTVSGILGGFPLPGTRFLGTNALTNPFITAITAPEYMLTVALKTPSAVANSFVRAFRRTGLIPGDKAYDPLKMMYMGDETAVMFTAVDGTVWTKGMFQEEVLKRNIRFSQVSFEFSFDSYQDVIRATGLGPDGKNIVGMSRFVGGDAPSTAQWAEYLRPDKRNVWTMVAEEMDNVQREAVFAEALKRGLDVDSAAALARSSLLDYGSTPKVVRDRFAKHMAFVGFRYNMMVETMNAFLRDGRALNNMARQMNFVNTQRDSMEEWVLEPDWVKTRFWRQYGEKFKEFHSLSLGPGIPFADSVTMMTNVGGFIFDSKFRDSIGSGRLARGIGENLLGDPRIQQLLSIMELDGDKNAPDGYMPIEYISAFETFGAGDMLIDWFGLKKVAPDKMRADFGTYQGNQYMFSTEDDNRKFRWFQLGLLVTGLNRNIRDYPRQFASVGVEPDDIDFAKGAEGGPMFWLGGSVASYRDAAAAVDRLNRQYTREIQEGLRKTSF